MKCMGWWARDHLKINMEYLHTRRLCYGCRSETVGRDYEKCPNCRAIDIRRMHMKGDRAMQGAFARFLPFAILFLGGLLMWFINQVRRNLGG